MTCQWCKNYRRRDGISKCLFPSEDGQRKLVDIKGADACDKFDPRRSCTTCEYRCPPEEKGANMQCDGGCSKWILRHLTTWGGVRKFTTKN